MVLAADIEALPGISPTRDGDENYRQAWVFVFAHGRPLGKVEIALGDRTLSSNDVRALVTARLPTLATTEAFKLPAGARLPSASVVISTLGKRRDDLERGVESLLSLDYPDYEIVIVDNRRANAPGQPLDDWIAADPRIRIVIERRPGCSAAKNRGASVAGGEIIALSDDDIIVDRGWLQALVVPMVADTSIGAVTGLVLPQEVETIAQYWFEEYSDGFSRGFEPAIYIPDVHPSKRRPHRVAAVVCRDGSGNDCERISLYAAAARCATLGSMAVRSDLFRDTGGLDPLLGTGTRSSGGADVAFAAKLFSWGASLCYEPAAFSFHRHRRTYEELTKQIHSWGKGLTAMLTGLCWEDPGHILDISRHAMPSLRAVLHRSERSSHGPPARGSFPPQLRWHEIAGMIEGIPVGVMDRLSSRRERP
jgi:glycosyltransferase involved in cell wall biosynthesis